MAEKGVLVQALADSTTGSRLWAVTQVKWRRAYSDPLGLATTIGIATDASVERHCGGEEEVMQGRQRRQSWALTWLVLMLAVPALARVVRVGEEGQPQPEARVQVTQNLTIAVCGDTCDCIASSLLTRVSAPCDVTSSAGACNADSGACCVCAPN